MAILSIIFFGIQYAQQKEDVSLDHADSLVGLEINGEKARQLIGHVRLHQGSTVITCDSAIQYLATQKISMHGIVEVRDDTLRMVGSSGMYYPDLRIAEAFDRVFLEDPGTVLHAGYGKYFVNEKKAYFKTNVSVEDSTSVLTANELTYFREEQKSIAQGNVKIVNAKNGITIFGDHFENYKKNHYSKVTGQPRLIQIDKNQKEKTDTLEVTARLLESYQDTLERLIATDSVKIIRGELAAEAGHCTYYTDLDSIILKRQPFIWYTSGGSDENQVSGESIFIKLEKQKLKTVFVRERAVAISRADSLYINRFNQMSGQEIILHFADDKIKRVDVNMTATSLYYLFDKGKGNGLNKSTGDQIRMTFVDGKIDKINAISNVEGQYYPEKMVKGKETDFNLSEYNWRENRPGKR
jgi:lipopolysaccharide export system protein LptA